MELDISRRIRDALDSGSPPKNLSDLVAAIDAFVQQQQDDPDPAIIEQLQAEGEAIHREQMDRNSATTVEAFVTIMHAFLPIVSPLYVITCWWDLVLRPALREPRLSAKAKQQAKALILNTLTSDSPKAPEFRKRIIELFLLDVQDDLSRSDALEHATMSADEKRIQKVWKHNLTDILKEFHVQKPDEFLKDIDGFFKAPHRRVKLSVLLGDVVRSSTFRTKEFATHRLLDSFLLSLVVDGSSTLLKIELSILASLLPQLAVHAPDTLARILPSCFAILARAICWKPLSKSSNQLEQEHDRSDNLPQSSTSDPEADVAQPTQLRPDIDWERLDETLALSVSDPPSPYTLFRTLYGLFPCNTLAFLRDPAVYLKGTRLQTPFVVDWSEIIDEDQIRTRSRVLLRQTTLHSSLLTHTAESELAQRDRWTGWDVPRVVMMCTMVNVQNTALSLGHSPDPESYQEAHQDNNGLKPPSPSKSSPQQAEENLGFRGTGFSLNERPRVSVQDILATYHVLKSGVEIDIIDPTPHWPHMLAHSSGTPSFSGSGSTSRASSKGSDESIPPHVDEAISGLQRENLMLRTELNYERWLKGENMKRIGRLYEDRILVKGAEVERQGLHNKLREYKGQVQRLQDALTKEQTGASATKAQHADYTARLQARLRTEKADKQKWTNEKLELKSAYEDAKIMMKAQERRLADATESVFRLETEIKENAPKVKRLKDYEFKIDQLTKTQQLWDDDVRRYREQAVYIEDLRSRFRKKLLLIESFEKANRNLEDTIHSLQGRITVLESQTRRDHYRPPVETHSPTISKIVDTLREQVSSLTVERDALLNQTDGLGNQVEELRVTVETLQGQVGSVREANATLGG